MPKVGTLASHVSWTELNGVEDLPGSWIAWPGRCTSAGRPRVRRTWLDPLVAVEATDTALTPQGRMRGGRLNQFRTDSI